MPANRMRSAAERAAREEAARRAERSAERKSIVDTIVSHRRTAAASFFPVLFRSALFCCRRMFRAQIQQMNVNIGKKLN